MWKARQSALFGTSGLSSGSPLQFSQQLDLAGFQDFLPEIENNTKQVEDSRKLIETLLTKITKHISTTQIATDTGRDLAEAFLEAGEKSKGWEDVGALSEGFISAGGVLRTLEALRGNLIRSMQSQLRETLDDFIKSEIAAARTQRKAFDKSRTNLVAAEEKLKKERTARATEPRIFELEKERNALRDSYVEVQQQTFTTLVDTNGKCAVTTLSSLCSFLESSYELYDRGQHSLNSLKPALRDYRQSILSRSKRESARRDSLRRTESSSSSSSSSSGNFGGPQQLPIPPSRNVVAPSPTGESSGPSPRRLPNAPTAPGQINSSQPGGGGAIGTHSAAVVSRLPLTSTGGGAAPFGHRRTPSSTPSFTEASVGGEEVDYAVTKTVPPGEVKKEGLLMKKGQKRRNWVSRWWVLKRKYLFYYTSHVEKKLKGVIKLSNCCVEPSNRRLHAFTINCRLRTYFICASSAQEQEDWMNAITSCIDGIEKNASLIIEQQQDQQDSNSNSNNNPSGLASGAFGGMGLPGRRPPRPLPSGPKGGGGGALVSSKSGGAETTEEKVKRALQKYFASEKGYLKNLMSLKNYKFNMSKDIIFTRPPSSSSPPLLEQVNVMFANLDDIYSLHSGVLADLESLIQDWPKKSHGPILLHRAAGFEVYLPFVSGYSRAVGALAHIKKSSRGAVNFLKAQQAMDMSGLDLEALLSQPLERPAQFELLLAELLQRSDRSSGEYHNLELAYQKITEVCSQVDKGTTLSQNLAKNIQLKKKISGLDQIGVNLLDSSRVFIREGPLTLILADTSSGGGSKVEVMCFMFNDMMISAKENSFSKARLPSGLPSLNNIENVITNRPSYRFYEQYFFHRYSRLVDLPDSETTRNGFQLTDGKAQVVTFQAESARGKAEWMVELQKEMGVITRSKKVFGVSISDLMTTHERERGRDIPTFVEKAINFIITYALTTEGIFRLSGRVSEIQGYKDLLDQGKDLNFPAGTDHHAVCGLLKLWFREMPEPIIPFARYPAFLKTRELPSLPTKVSHLRQQIQQLPRPNQYLLQHMSSFFQVIVEMEELNKMNKRNLAIVFGPNLLSSGSDSFGGASGLDGVYEVFMMFVDHYDQLFSAIEEERRLKKEQWLKEQEQEHRKERQEKEAVEALLKEGAAMASGQHNPGSVSSAVANVDKIVRQGWLTKKGAQRRNWNTRWFVLRYKSLGYYKTPQDITALPKGKILLSACRVRSSDIKPFSFQIECKDRTYLVTAKNAQEQAEWISDIESCIEN